MAVRPARKGAASAASPVDRYGLRRPICLRLSTSRRARADAELERALQREADAQAQSYASADYAEGLAAVRAKRPPAFDGA